MAKCESCGHYQYGIFKCPMCGGKMGKVEPRYRALIHQAQYEKEKIGRRGNGAMWSKIKPKECDSE